MHWYKSNISNNHLTSNQILHYNNCPPHFPQHGRALTLESIRTLETRKYPTEAQAFQSYLQEKKWSAYKNDIYRQIKTTKKLKPSPGAGKSLFRDDDHHHQCNAIHESKLHNNTKHNTKTTTTRTNTYPKSKLTRDRNHLDNQKPTQDQEQTPLNSRRRLTSMHSVDSTTSESETSDDMIRELMRVDLAGDELPMFRRGRRRADVY